MQAGAWTVLAQQRVYARPETEEIAKEALEWIAASEGSLPRGPRGLSFFAGVSEGFTGVWARAAPALSTRSATVPVRTMAKRAGFIAADSSNTGKRGRCARSRRWDSNP